MTIAVALKYKNPGVYHFFGLARLWLCGRVLIVVDDYSVMADGDECIFHLFVSFEFGRSKVYVVGLPTERREHMLALVLDAVDPAELIHATFQTKGIKHLSFKATLMVYTAIGASLAPVEWFVCCHHLDVALVVSEFTLGLSLSHKTVFVHLCIVPFIGVAAVKKDDCTLGGFLSKGRGLTFDAR